jgi:hypothetical protein
MERRVEPRTDVRLWDWDDLSNFLKIPVPTLKKWCFQGKLPSLRLGAGRHALIRFEPAKIMAWLKEHELMPKSYD